MKEALKPCLGTEQITINQLIEIHMMRKKSGNCIQEKRVKIKSVSRTLLFKR